MDTMVESSESLWCERQRRTVRVGVAAASALLAVSVMARPGVAFGADTALILGGTGLPNPPPSYVDAVEKRYLAPNGYSAYSPQVVITPEQAYPMTGVTSLPVDTSVAQGVDILDSAIQQQLAAGNHVVVFAYSQGAIVATQEMTRLAESSNPPTGNQVSFVLVGDPSNPNGGLNQRFGGSGVPLSLPSLGTTFNLAPTASTTYPTVSYSQEYDGFADFPQYPINLLADLNAYLGLLTQHFGYTDLTLQQISSAQQLTTTGNTTTHYYMVPTPNLPLLVPLRLIPIIGNPLADLLQPDLKVLVNLGYGSITNGWSSSPANVPTPAGLWPSNIKLSDVVSALASGAVQGVAAALNDLKSPTLFDTSSLSLLLSGLHTTGLTSSATPTVLQLLNGFATIGNAGIPVSASGGIVNTLTDIVSKDLAVALPLVDTGIALSASLIHYDAQVFTSELRAGHPFKAVAMPIAADFGVVPYAVIAGTVFPIVGAVASTVTQLAQLAGLLPNPASAAAGGSAVSGHLKINMGSPAVSATGPNHVPAPSAATGRGAVHTGTARSLGSIHRITVAHALPASHAVRSTRVGPD